MKVLMMHHGDRQMGGGQVQLGRLYEGLRRDGVDARILCRDRACDDSVQMPARPRLERWLRRATRRLGFNEMHLVSSWAVKDLPEFRAADLIDYHCLHCETLSYLALPALTRLKPSVFTFHDMWPLTGRCHASVSCQRWMAGCGTCPQPEIEPRARRDATALEWRLKNWSYQNSRFTIVTPSRWLYERTRESMLRDHPLRHIPHGIDTTLYQPLDRAACRRLLGLPSEANVLLCAMESMARPLKGADLLADALGGLPRDLRRQCVLLFFGTCNPAVLRRIDMPICSLGYLSNDRLKTIAFSAADLFVNPTRAENFPVVVLESMACATPVVSFAVGGVPEMVRPDTTGWLAPPESAEALGDGIVKMLERGDLATMSRRCRDIVLAEYPLELQVKRYHQLYLDTIQDFN